MNTVTIINNNEVKVNVPQDYEHTQRLIEVLGKERHPELFKHTLNQVILKEKGFTLVKRNIENKFKYKAGIQGGYATPKHQTIFNIITILTGLIIGAGLSLVLYFYTSNILWLASIVVACPSFIFCGFGVIKGLNKNGLLVMKSVDYVGDIPEFVMDNLKSVKDICDCPMNIVVYSCEPLPIEEPFKKVDPVMIAWPENGNYGVIIGIWDRDKEVTI